jgi:uncharacterized protein YjdB
MRVAMFVALALSILAACRNGNDHAASTGPDCVLNGPTASPPSATLHPGDTLRMRASYTPCPAGLPASFRWRSSDTVIAVVDSLTGLVRARSLGHATIIAAVVTEPTLVAAMALQVEQ